MYIVILTSKRIRERINIMDKLYCSVKQEYRYTIVPIYYDYEAANEKLFPEYAVLK